MITYEETLRTLKQSQGLVTVFIINTLDQDLNVQIKGNRRQTTTNAASVGTAFSIAANSSDYRTLIAEASGVLPWIYLELSCGVAPTTGNVTAYLVKGKDKEETLVDALEIRDTITHSPNTDPGKVLIKVWWL